LLADFVRSTLKAGKIEERTMPTEIHMSIQGVHQGKFKGKHPKKTWIPVANLSMAGGDYTNKPVKVSVPWGNWSPQIFSAMMSYERLKVVLKVVGGGNGTYDLIQLIHTLIASVATHSGSSHSAGQVQNITMYYEKAYVGTHHHKTATDGWDLERVLRSFGPIHFGSSGGKSSAFDDQIMDDWTV
jgi:hypothetical protein